MPLPSSGLFSYFYLPNIKTMEIPKTYNPEATEDKWYQQWMDHGFFHAEPDDREPYTIVIPPPNVTGVLHMGHMLNNTIQDVLVRRKRMQGYNTCWVPGTDHASIATEAKVVKKLKDEGIEKSDLSREEFLEHAWEWKEKHGGIILEQLKKLGASCDWERTRFTMEEDLSDAVLEVFVDLYRKGYIYRGARMVNWDPQGLTAVSDEEVIHKEVQSKLYHVRYQVEGSDNEWITIATTRPETILGDTAVCVHPDDDRYKHLHGQRVIIPMVERSVPIITDDYITMEFGTGALKVTPAHDVNDYELGLKHKLEVIDTINDDGTMSEAAQFYVGEDRFVVREKIVKDLAASGHLVKTEDYVNKVGHSERTDAVIEPKLSLQWFLKMDELVKPAVENVMNGNIKLIPGKFINTYKHWMENIHNWCISRQLWWGHQIPAWYCGHPDCKDVLIVQQGNPESCPNCGTSDRLRQDEDVLDTWFSSWLWPISVFDGFKDPDNPDINYYYPTNDLVTAPEILFFWVARMIIAGYEYRDDKPFENVYLTGIVRDDKGRKMSKQLGNSPDPLDLIAKYGADGVRIGMLLCSPAGNDLLFDEKLCEQGRNFCNKIWNAFRLIKGWSVDETIAQPDTNQLAVSWFEARLQEVVGTVDDQFNNFRISEALMQVYRFAWDDFCSWYLEMIKPGFEQPIDQDTYNRTIGFMEALLKLLHPFTPFISEELWHAVADRSSEDYITVSDWPKANAFEAGLLAQFQQAKEVISGIRNIRKEKNISPKKPLNLSVLAAPGSSDRFDPVVRKLGHLEDLEYVSEEVDNSISFMVGSDQYFLPVGGTIDLEEETRKIREELDYTKGFLTVVMKKLNNPGFINNADPQIVEKEKQKKADAESKIRKLEESLVKLTGAS